MRKIGLGSLFVVLTFLAIEAGARPAVATDLPSFVVAHGGTGYPPTPAPVQ